MEKIINPELQHLAENIFLNLNAKDLKACQLINRSANQILDNNPMFWAKKYIVKGLSTEISEDLIKAVQLKLKSGKEKPIALYLKWNFLSQEVANLPQYRDDIIEIYFREKLYCGVIDGDTKIVTILAPLMNNPNAPINGMTPIYRATVNGFTEVVKILESRVPAP